jgi:hypothetical protein
MPFQTFDLETRGILNRNTARAVPPNYVKEALNLVAQHGRWRSRAGIRPFTGAKSAGIIRGAAYHYRSDGSRDVLTAAGATIQRNPPFGDPVTLPLTSLPATEQTRVDPTAGVRFLSISGTDALTFIYDGVNPNLKWAGTVLTRVGIVPPTAPAAPTNIAGSVNPGQRKYVRTLWSPYHESNPSDSITVTQVGTGGKRFTSPVQGVDFDDPQVTAWKLYATVAGGARFFFVGKADLGIVIDHTVADNALGPTALEELVNETPDAKIVSAVEHNGRVFAVFANDRNVVRFCHGTGDYIAPEGWPLGNSLPVAHGDGDEIQLLVSFFEWLVVFKKRGTFSITGNINDGFQIKPVIAAGGALRTGIGCVAAGGVIHLENEIAFPSRDGFYVIERANSLTGGLQSTKISDAIDGIYRCTNFARGSAATYDRTRRIYTFWAHG